MWTAPLNVVRFDATTLWHFDAGSGRRPPHQKRTHALQQIPGTGKFSGKSVIAGRSALSSQRFGGPQNWLIGCDAIVAEGSKSEGVATFNVL
jgi:hypothetical protein